MPVYVDNAAMPYGRMIMSHMLADSLPELHAMAERIGIQRKWFQNRNIPHYDICKSKKALALKLGAIPVPKGKVLELIRQYRRESENIRGNT